MLRRTSPYVLCQAASKGPGIVSSTLAVLRKSMFDRSTGTWTSKTATRIAMLFFWPNVKKCSKPTQSISKHLQQLQIPSVFRISWDSIMVQPVVQPVGNWAADIKVMIPETAILLRVQDLQQSLGQVTADFTKDNGDIGVHFPNLQKGGRKDEEMLQSTKMPTNFWQLWVFPAEEGSPRISRPYTCQSRLSRHVCKNPARQL